MRETKLEYVLDETTAELVLIASETDEGELTIGISARLRPAERVPELLKQLRSRASQVASHCVL